MSQDTETTYESDDPASSESQLDLAAGNQAFCFITNQANYKTIMADSRDEAQKKGNRNIIYGPVHFCHDGACQHDGEGYPNSDESCDS